MHVDFILLRKLSESTKIPITVYRLGENVFQWPAQNHFQSYFDVQKEALSALEDTLARQDGLPFLFIEDARYYFGTFQAEGNLVIFGPIATEKASLDTLLAFKKKHQLTQNACIPKSSPYRLSAALSLAYYEYTGLDIDPDSIRIINVSIDLSGWNTEAAMEHYALEQSEMDRDHDSSEYEDQLINIVMSGDVEAMERILYSAEQLGSEHIGVVATDPDKNTEYLCVTMLIMLPRAAVRGGMNREDAFSLADIYLQKLARSTSPSQMLSLTGRAQYEFTLEVKKAKEKRKASLRHPYIEDCKAYIQANLRKPFQIQDIAPAIGVNRSYLARRFSEVEGMTVQQYITKERCAHAANLLIHSDYSISLIAQYFCFSSQSHFGRAFKAYTGMTPKAYRDQYKR